MLCEIVYIIHKVYDYKHCQDKFQLENINVKDWLCSMYM